MVLERTPSIRYAHMEGTSKDLFRQFRELLVKGAVVIAQFTIEELISQMLATADVGFLHAVFQEQHLAHVLFEQLDFLGQVPKAYLPTVRAYLHVQEPSLRETVERLVKEPDNDALREQMC